MTASTKASTGKQRRSDKVLVIFTRACAPYAKGEIAALPTEMAQTVLNPSGTRPAVAELHLGGTPQPRDKHSDGTSAIDVLRRQKDRAEGALSAALDKLEEERKGRKG